MDGNFPYNAFIPSSKSRPLHYANTHTPTILHDKRNTRHYKNTENKKQENTINHTNNNTTNTHTNKCKLYIINDT